MAGRDAGIVVADIRPNPVAEPLKTAEIRNRNRSRRQRPLMTKRGLLRRNREALVLLPTRFCITKTQSGRRHLRLLSLDHRNVFFYPDHTRFGPKQGRKAAV